MTETPLQMEEIEFLWQVLKLWEVLGDGRDDPSATKDQVTIISIRVCESRVQHYLMHVQCLTFRLFFTFSDLHM